MSDIAIYNQAERLKDRNTQIYVAHCFGSTHRDLAEQFHMSEANVRRICDQVKATAPERARDQLRDRLTEAGLLLLRSAVEIYDKPAPPIVDQKGNYVRDPETREVSRDYSMKIKSGEYMLKIVDRLSKLAGADAPVQHEVTVAAGQAAIEQATKVTAQFTGLRAVG